jgi:hypothetical protein
VSLAAVPLLNVCKGSSRQKSHGARGEPLA